MSDIARRLRRQERSPVIIALAATLVVALIALAVVAWQWRDASGRYHAETEARVVAEQRTQQILTWSAATLDEDAAWADDGATARFRGDYDEILDGLRETYGALTASSSGTVLASSPRASSAEAVEVTVFAEQHVLRGATGEESCVLSSIVWTMVRDGGEWLVDALEAPGAPVPVPC